jgi:hypothetical protein
MSAETPPINAKWLRTEPLCVFGAVSETSGTDPLGTCQTEHNTERGDFEFERQLCDPVHRPQRYECSTYPYNSQARNNRTVGPDPLASNNSHMHGSALDK